MRSVLLLCFFLMLPIGSGLRASDTAASDSLEFPAFSEALGRIFSADKIESILSKLPPNCKIYGYDIGEFSGDDGMDVVLSTRPAQPHGSRIDVHFFMNAGSEFRLVRTLERHFIREPIEVGFSIERGTAFVTEKTSEFGWRITGYAIDHEVFRRVSQWTTGRMKFRGVTTAVGYERSHDLRTNLSEEHYYGTNSSKTFLRQKYYDLPVFRDGDDVPRAINRQIGDSTGLMIVRGGSSWHGPDDCSIFCTGSYDTSSVTLHLAVHDDRLLYSAYTDSTDYASIAFDFSRKTRVRPGGGEQSWSPNTEFEILMIMGDGEKRTPVVELRGKQLSEKFGSRVAVTVTQDPDEFHVFRFTVRLPLEMFERDGEPVPAGMVCSYHDVDAPAHPGWVSLAATSRGYTPGAPETYGRLHFVSNAREAYEWFDLRTREIARQLRRAGILP